MKARDRGSVATREGSLLHGWASKALSVLLAVVLIVGMAPYHASAQGEGAAQTPVSTGDEGFEGKPASADGGEGSEEPEESGDEASTGSDDRAQAADSPEPDAHAGITEPEPETVSVSGDEPESPVALQEAEMEEQAVESGSFDQVEWELDAAGVLTIGPAEGQSEGTLGSAETVGNIDRYGLSSTVRSKVKSVKIQATVRFAGDCSYLFASMANLVAVDLSGAETSGCTGLSHAFGGCTHLHDVNFGSCDFAGVKSIDGIFEGCSSLESIGLGSVSLGAPLESAKSSFSGCSKLVELDLGGMSCSASTETDRMFQGCSALDKLTLGARFSFGKWSGAMNPGLSCEEWKLLGPGHSGITSQSLYESFDGSTMAGTYLNYDPHAVLYDGYEIVFQKGIETDSTRSSQVFKLTDHGWKSSAKGITKARVVDEISPTSLEYWFADMENLPEIEGLSKIDVSKVTSMAHMFENCASLREVDTSGFNGSRVSSVGYMFRGCTSLISLDLQHLDTSNLNHASHMFEGCTALESLNLGTMEMNQVRRVDEMFSGCGSLYELNVAWTGATNINQADKMFYGCSKLASIDLVGFNVSNVSSLQSMFEGCSSLVNLNVTGMLTSSVTNAKNMFKGCSSLVTLDISSFDFTHKVESLQVQGMLSGCDSLKTLVLGPKFSTGTRREDANLPGDQWVHRQTGEVYISESLFPNYDGATMAGTYERQTYYALLYQTGDLVFQIGDTPDASLGELQRTFTVPNNRGATANQSPEWVGNSWRKLIQKAVFKDDLRPDTMQSWFSGCENLETVEGFEKLHTDYVSSFVNLFSGCHRLQAINVKQLDAARAASMDSAFKDCRALEALDLSQANLGSVGNLSRFLSGCTNLKQVRFPSVVGSDSTTSYSSFFQDCSSLTSVDVSSFKTANASMISFFKGCSGLVELDLSAFAGHAKGNVSDMFAGADNLGVLKLGEAWSFPTSRYQTGLPGKWARDQDSQAHTSDELRSLWSAERAGTYYRQLDVVLDANGGAVSPSVASVKYQHAFGSSLPSPQRDNYTFEGWYTEKTGGRLVQADTVIDQVVTGLYARWVPRSYTLVLDANDLSGRRQLVSLKYDETYTLGRDFLRSSAMITGWNTHPSGSGTAYLVGDDVSRLANGDGQIVLYAQWKQLTCTLRFDAQGGTEVPDRKMAEGDVYGAPPETSRAGFTFLGWYTSKASSGGTAYAADKVASADALYYARWGKNPVVSFDADGGTAGASSLELTYNTTVSPLPTASKSGYQFAGWFDSRGRQLATSTKFTADASYKAKWKIGPLYNLNGVGTIRSEYTGPDANTDPEHYVVGGFPEVESHDHTLIGWFTASTGGTRVNAGDTIDVCTTPVLYAQWQAKPKVTVAFDSQGGSAVPSRTLFKGATLVELPQPTRTGYRFEGWSTVAGGAASAIAGGTAIDADTTLYALWENEGALYTVSFYANGSSGSIRGGSKYSIDVYDGQKIPVLPGCTRTGYVFDGWYTDPFDGRPFLADEPVTGPLSLYAHWRQPVEYASSSTTEIALSAYWTTSSGPTVENTGTNIDLHPTAYQAVKADLFVEMKVTSLAGGQTAIPRGAAVIRVPKYLFRTWDNVPTATITNLKTQLAEYPGKSKNMSFSYREGVDYYELVNVDELASDTTFGMRLSYSVDPTVVPGGRMNDDGTYNGGSYAAVPVTAQIDVDANGSPEVSCAQNLTAEFHGNPSSRHSLLNHTPTTYYLWQSSWGAEPSDSDDYFYVSWELYSSNAPASHQSLGYEWDFNTAYDGEIISAKTTSGSLGSKGGSQTGHVVLRYPKTLLGHLGTEPVVLHNEAVVHETWQDGVTADRAVAASYTLSPDKSEVGSLKKEYGANRGIVNGGQETILDDASRVTMPYQITYSGRDNVAPTFDAVSGGYALPERTISVSDGGRGSVLFASNADSDGFAWEPAAGNVELGENDYAFTQIGFKLTEYDSQYFGSAWVAPYQHTNSGDYQRIEIWVRLRGSNEWFLFDTRQGAGSGTVNLPANSVAFDVRHVSTFYSTQLTVSPVLTLIPTDRVRQLVLADTEQHATSVVKNISQAKVTHDGGAVVFEGSSRHANENARTASFELNLSKTTLKAGASACQENRIEVDVANRVQEGQFVMSGFNYNNSGRIKPMTSGVFYNLLPAETSVDEGTLQGCYRTENSNNVPGAAIGTKIDPGSFAVSYVPNWQGSGRTMMVVNVAASQSIRATGFVFQYELRNTYENIVATGTQVPNDVLFVNTSGAMTPYDSVVGSVNVVSEPGLYRELEGRFGVDRSAFAKDVTHYVDVNAYTYEFSVAASAADTGSYSGNVVLTPHSDYVYRLMYSQSDVASGSGIVMYDVLDRNVEIDGSVSSSSGWEGSLASVDVRPMQSVPNYSTRFNCSPVVYYATKNRDSFTADDFDLARTDIWSAAVPSDLSSVTAVAIDCSHDERGNVFELRGQEYLAAYIHMSAPADAALIGQDATNGALLKTAVNGVVGASAASARVQLRDFNLQLSKSASPASGSAEAPAIVYRGDDIVYALDLSNSGEATAREIVVEDAIPAPLHVSTGEMTVSVSGGSAIALDASPRLSASLSGNDLTLVVHEVRAGETLHVEIPAYGDSAETALMSNTAHVRTVNGVVKTLDSNTTYHKYIGAGTLVVRKRIEGPRVGVDTEFEFTVRLWSSDVNFSGPISCDVTNVGEPVRSETLQVVNGVATFKLKDGDEASLGKVPIGLNYRVSEKDYRSAGYMTSVVGQAEGAVMNERPLRVLFVNDSSDTPYVGVKDPVSLPLAPLALLVAALLIGVKVRRSES